MGEACLSLCVLRVLALEFDGSADSVSWGCSFSLGVSVGDKRELAIGIGIPLVNNFCVVPNKVARMPEDKLIDSVSVSGDVAVELETLSPPVEELKLCCLRVRSARYLFEKSQNLDDFVCSSLPSLEDLSGSDSVSTLVDTVGASKGSMRSTVLSGIRRTHLAPGSERTRPKKRVLLTSFLRCDLTFL